MTRTGTVLLLAALAAPAASAAAQAPAPATPLARVAPADPQVPVRGQSAVMPVTCDPRGTARCTGRLVLRARLDGTSAVVGRRTFSIPNGFTAPIAVGLTAAARKAIAARNGRLTITANTHTTRTGAADGISTRKVRLRTRASAPPDDVPELTWVEMRGRPTVVYTKCGSTPMSATFSASGKTDDRLPGTFTEQGSWMRTGGPLTEMTGPLKTTFTITSGPWSITGTRTIDVQTPCGQHNGENMNGGGTYEATLTKTENGTRTTYKDAGLAFAYFDGDGVRRAGFMTSNGGSQLAVTPLGPAAG